MNAPIAAEPWPDLIGSLTHELRHEASAVLHQVELLRGNVLDDVTRQRSLAAIEANAENLMGFIDDLTELGRIVRGEVTPVCRSIDIGELIGAAADDRARQLDWKAPITAGNAAWSTFTDPHIVDQIVTGVLNQYDRHADAGAVVSAYARRSTDRYIDVVFTSNTSRALGSEPFRSATLGDGLSMFVAHKSAELVGGTFGVLGSTRRGSYLLRLPHAERSSADRQWQD